MPDLVPDALWDLAVRAFLLVSGIAFTVYGALGFRRAAASPRGWDRALHAVHALVQVGFGLVVLWALWVTST